MKQASKIVAIFMAVVSVFLLVGCQSSAPEEVYDGMVYTYNKDNTSYTLKSCESVVYNPTIDKVNGLPVTTVGERAFAGPNGEFLQTVTFGDSVKTIERQAFFYSPKLNHITFGNGIQVIGEEAFGDCDSLVSLNIPDSVLEIGDRAFYICDDQLRHVNIGKQLVTLGDEVFEGCLKLAYINLPITIRNIGSGVFDECESLQYVYYEGTAEDWAKVNVEDENDILLAHLYFYSQEQPQTSGRYWHYNDEGKRVIW